MEGHTDESKRINISEPVAEICARLGVAPEYVKQMVLNPADAEVTVYKARNGGKYIEQDGEPAVITLLFDIRT